MDITQITPELLKRAKACKAPDELVRLASEEGIELSDEDLEKVSGGGIWDEGGSSPEPCPFCGSTDTYEDTQAKGAPRPITVCRNCGMTW